MKTGDVVRGILDDNPEESENENENGEAEENPTVLCDAAGNDVGKCPENYMPVNLLAFVLYGPPSDEPIAAWNDIMAVGAPRNKRQPPVDVTPKTPSTSGPSTSPSDAAFSVGVKGYLSRGELQKLQHEHNGKSRTGGDVLLWV